MLPTVKESGLDAWLTGTRLRETATTKWGSSNSIDG